VELDRRAARPSYDRDRLSGVAGRQWIQQQAEELRTMMGWYNDGIGWGGWIAMTLMMVTFWGLVIFAVVAIFRGTTKATEPAAPAAPRDPMSTLDERFARGEIDAEEYHSRQAILRDTKHHTGR